jgi:hypothetical protein
MPTVRALGVTIVLVLTLVLQDSGSAQDAGMFVLEIPTLGVEVPGNGTMVLKPGAVTHFRIRVQRQTGQVNYGNIFSTINTEAANIVMTTRSTATGMVCEFDLTRRDGFRLRPGRNSIEITLQDVRGRLHYASFLLETSGDPGRTSPAAPVISAPGQKFAVVIGIARHRFADAGITNLKFADRDATQLRDFLLSPEGGSFRRENVVLLLNEDATAERIRNALSDSLAGAGADDFVLVYFSGHGIYDPADPRRYYLMAYDTRPDGLAETGLAVGVLEDLFGRALKTPWSVALFDAARVGSLPRGPAGSNNLVHQYLVRYTSDRGRSALSAANIGETSWETDTLGGGHGAFTHFLLRGLRGEADRDRDGTVTVREAREYVADQVRRATGGQQNPFGPENAGDGLALAGLGSRGVRQRAGR